MKKVFSILLLSFSFSLIGQNLVPSGIDYPKNDFRNPLGIQNLLSGNFGELRNNHFHSGIDIKTNGKEGYRVYAACDGFVSRVNVSPVGYGNAIYIDHPNGYTTVYGHLQGFNEEIEEFVRAYQYQNEKFAVEIYPEKNQIKISEGDVIALSGNSGSSGGPHLHFEIRDTKSEEPINPFLFGLDIPDTRRPLVNGLYLYELNGPLNGETRRRALSNGQTISAAGKVGFAIKTYDKQNGADNMNGTYQINLFVDEQPYFTFTAERTNFDTTRGINRLIDYEDKSKNYSWVYMLFQPDGNPLQHMFSNVQNNGIIELKEGDRHQIRLEAMDYAGNKNTANFTLVGNATISEPQPGAGDIIFKWDEKNHFKEEGIEINMPSETIYNDLIFKYRKTNNGKHEVHDYNVPVHSYYTISIAPEGISASDLDKTIIKREYKYRGAWKSEFIYGEYKDGMVTGKTRDFGFFSVVTDKTKPVIEPLNIKENSTFTGSNGIIRFRITDSQLGVEDFSVHIDGKWVLPYYDYKTRRLTVNLNREGIPAGRHQLELKVWDEKKNTAVYTVNFNKK